MQRLRSPYLARGNYVVKSNALVRDVRQELGLPELRGLNFIISLIKPNTEILEYTFPIKYYLQVCDLAKSGNMYKAVRESIGKLGEKVWVTRDDKDILLAFLSNAILDKTNGTITVYIDKMIAPYLFNLRKQYTQYELMNILKMKSQYSIRLYELCKSYQNVKSFVVDPEELKWILYCDGKKTYEKFGMFRNRILDPSIEEINELTDILVSMELVHEGRGGRVKEIKFHIKDNPNLTKDDQYEKLFGLDERLYDNDEDADFVEIKTEKEVIIGNNFYDYDDPDLPDTFREFRGLSPAEVSERMNSREWVERRKEEIRRANMNYEGGDEDE